MPIQTRLTAGEDRAVRRSCCGLLADRQLLIDHVAVTGDQAKHGKQQRQVIVDTVNIPLGVHELVEGDNVVVGE